MAGLRFVTGMHFILNGREYFITEFLLNGDIKIKDILTDDVRPVPKDFLIKAYSEGNLELRGTDQRVRYVEEKATKLLSSYFDLLPDKAKEEARRREKYVKEIRKQRLDKRTKEALEPIINKVSQEINDVSKPAWITVYRWDRDYTASDEDIRSLLPKGHEKKSKLDPDAFKVMSNVVSEVFMTLERPSVNSVHELLPARIDNANKFRDLDDQLTCPHYTTLLRYISRLDQYDLMVARYGKRYADQHFMAAQQGPRPTRPLERVEMDFAHLPFFVIDVERNLPIGKPRLAGSIDVFSKMVTGIELSFIPDGYLSVMRCLRHAILPKTYVKDKYPEIVNTWDAYGIPETLVVDNGKVFHSKHFEDACLQLGITIDYSPPKVPWYRPSIERYFGTLNTNLLSGQPGTTFSNFIEKADYDPQKNAVISLNTLLEIIHVWIIDIYLQKEHSGIKDIPALVWKAGIEKHPPALPPHRMELNVLLGEIMHKTVSSAGIEFCGLLYNHSDLIALRRVLKKGEKAIVKYDPSDISLLYAFHPLNSEFIKVPALDQKYTQGLSLWQHEVIKKYARQRIKGTVNIIHLSRSKEKIREIVARDYERIGKSSTRQKMARWLDDERQGQIHAINQDSRLDADSSASIQESAQDEVLLLNPAVGPLSGISNVGNALNNKHDSPAPEEATESITGSIGEREASNKPKKSRGRPKKNNKGNNASQESEQSKDKIEQDNLNAHKNDSDLDLTGWSADYDLPK